MVARNAAINADVGCAGILVADMICHPMAQLPQPGAVCLVDDITVGPGGCAANVAITLARQGIAVDVAGCIGHDPLGKIVIDSLQDLEINCSRIIRSPSHPTCKTVVLLVAGEDRRFIHAIGANAGFSVSQIEWDWVQRLKVFYFGGLFVMPGIEPRALLNLLRRCRNAGVITVVDVILSDHSSQLAMLDDLLPQIDYFLPNRDEATILTGERQPLVQLAALRAKGARRVVITDGSAGSLALDGDHLWQAPAYPADRLDPSGAGDAYAAGLITGMIRGWDFPAMLRYGSALGASAVRAPGTTTSVFRPPEAEAFMAAHAIEVREIPWN